MPTRIVTLGVVGVLLGVVAGCPADNPLNRKGLSGTVTFNGEPAKGGEITFVPLSDPTTISGGVIRDGGFTIATEKGVAPGAYGVSISIPDPDWTREKARNAKIVSPPDWVTGQGHQVTVTENGPNHFEFAVVNHQPVVYGPDDTPLMYRAPKSK